MRTRQRVVDMQDEDVGEIDRTIEPTTVEATESSTRFSPAQLVHGAIGVFLVVLGIISLARGDFSGDLTDPTFELIGITHNTAIGLGELVAGALLLLAAASPYSRMLGLVVGLGLVVFGALLIADEGTRQDLATEEALGWLSIGVGGGAALAALIPSRRTTRRRVDRYSR